MNPELTLYLEENGFVFHNPWWFSKLAYHSLEKKIKIVGTGTHFGNKIMNNFVFEIEVYTVEEREGRYDESLGLFLLIEITKTNHFDLKIKKIINEIDDIITIAHMFEGLTEFTDNSKNHSHDMIFSSENGVTIDISREELLIMNNDKKLSMVL